MTTLEKIPRTVTVPTKILFSQSPIKILDEKCMWKARSFCEIHQVCQ